MTTAILRIPTPLRAFTNGADEVRVECASVGEALTALGKKHPGLLERVLDANGKLRPFVNVYVGPNDVRTLDGLATRVADGSVLSIVPAVAGGARIDRTGERT